MRDKISQLLSGGSGNRKEKVGAYIRRSHPLFVASCTDGILFAAANDPGMPSRIDTLIDCGCLGYGGIGSLVDINAICIKVGAAANWDFFVAAGPEDVHAEYLAHRAARFIRQQLEDSLAEPRRASVVFSMLGLEQTEDRIYLTDEHGRVYHKEKGWVILPSFVPQGMSAPWFVGFRHDTRKSMRKTLGKFFALGEIWRDQAPSSSKDLVWEIGVFRRDMVRKNRPYEIFERFAVRYPAERSVHHA